MSRAAPAGAAKSKPPPSPTAQKIQALRNQVDDVSADEAALLDQLDNSKSRLDDLNARVADLDQQRAPVQQALHGAPGQLDELGGRQLAAETPLADPRGRLVDARQ